MRDAAAAAPRAESRAPSETPAPRLPGAARGGGLDPSRVLALQAAAGNRAVARLVRGHEATAGVAYDDELEGEPELHDAGDGIVIGEGSDSLGLDPWQPERSRPEIIDPWETSLSHVTTEQAPDGTGDDRTTVGLGEEVTFSMGGAAVSWTASSGEPRTATGPSFAWKSGEPGVATITGTNAATGDHGTVRITSIVPERMRFTRMFNHRPPGIPTGRGGAGMQQRVDFEPMSVSFHNTMWREHADTSVANGPGTPQAVQGYFATRIAAGARFEHHPGSALRIRRNNTLNDLAVIFGLRPPFADGSFHFRIPNRFRRATPRGREFDGPVTVQRFYMRTNGNCRVRKGDASTGWVAPV